MSWNFKVFSLPAPLDRKHFLEGWRLHTKRFSPLSERLCTLAQVARSARRNDVVFSILAPLAERVNVVKVRGHAIAVGTSTLPASEDLCPAVLHMDNAVILGTSRVR
jgi:hypothetical protein